MEYLWGQVTVRDCKLLHSHKLGVERVKLKNLLESLRFNWIRPVFQFQTDLTSSNLISLRISNPKLWTRGVQSRNKIAVILVPDKTKQLWGPKIQICSIRRRKEETISKLTGLVGRDNLWRLQKEVDASSKWLEVTRLISFQKRVAKLNKQTLSRWMYFLKRVTEMFINPNRVSTCRE